jgi:ElaB/YqjD/DUF883 family membrane-anchored ribosome-binding protein
MIDECQFCILLPKENTMNPETQTQSVDNLKKEFLHTAEKVGEYVSESAKDQYGNVEKAVKEYIKENPLLSVGIAAAIGVVLTTLLTRK